MNITFKDSTVEDCKIIRSWIKSNEFARHWYYLDKTPRLSTLERKMAKKLNEPKTKAKIVFVDNVPIGYIQSYPVNIKTAWGKKVGVAENMVSIDYYIGDINYIHKGIGSKMILEYIEQVIKKENEYKVAMISPDPENKASCRCVEKCGFKYVKTVNVPYVNSKEKEAVYIKEI